MTNSETET